MEIITRDKWGARYEAGDGPAPLPAREVWLHHSVTVAPDLVPPFDDEDAAMRHLEQIGEDRFGRGISYTFAVMPTGRVYEGHGVGTLGAHTAKRNGFARAIVLVGNCDESDVTMPQIESVARLLVDGHRAGWWTAARLNGGHCQAPGASTACPGRHGLAAIPGINTLAAELLAAPATPTSLPHAPEGEPVQLIALGSATGSFAGWYVVDWAAGTAWGVAHQEQLSLIRASGKVAEVHGLQPVHVIDGLHLLGAQPGS